MSHDPFNDSASELRGLVVSGRLLQQQLTQHGVAGGDIISQLDALCEDMEDILSLLKETMRVIDEKGGKVHGKVFSANEIVDRQNTVRTLDLDVSELSSFCADVKKRQAAAVAYRTRSGASAEAGVDGSPGAIPDTFLTTQELVQQEEMMQQDAVMDRLSYGLQELRETGVHINSELETQEVLLDDMERDITGVQARLRDANAKVDKLLASLSNKGKVCTIVVLIFILIFLAFFAFS